MTRSTSLAGQGGSTLVTVLIFSCVTLLVLGSTLQWMTTNVTLCQRQSQYFRTVAVAEAATEKVIANLIADYQTGGDALVRANVSAYTRVLPTASENSQFGQFKFSDGQNHAQKCLVQTTGTTQYKVLAAQYRGLRGYSTPFRILANATQDNALYQITGAVCQDIEMATIPLFQFAAFYNIDLEINPGVAMEMTGPVHCNDNIYLQPQDDLVFHGDVTSADAIILNKKPGDPSVRSAGTITYEGRHDSGTSSLNLPIGTDNSPTAVHQVVEKPPAGELSSSQMGQQRFYNKADMIITVTGDSIANVTVTSGILNNKATTVPAGQFDSSRNPPYGGFLSQTSFFNKRENKTVKALQIDVNKLRLWSSRSTNILRANLPAGDVTTIFVDDQRTATSSSEPGVRLVNGSVLPSKGLTLATQDPIYVQGSYNTSDGLGHTSAGADTTYTKPAALIGDAITILSGAWADANATQTLGGRQAADTTVNAAFLGGIVPTTTGSYSGGLENLFRFLEDWSGNTFTYNGSIVVMYPSRYAVGAWGGTGDDFGIYNPPTRKWAFDVNFTDVTKLPPGTPSARRIVRGKWSMVMPGTATVVNP